MLRSLVFTSLLHHSATFSRLSVSEAEVVVTRCVDSIQRGHPNIDQAVQDWLAANPLGGSRT